MSRNPCKIIGLGATLMLLTACAQNSIHLDLAAPDKVKVPQTASSYQGTLPCADCPGIDMHLDLLPDGRYFLQEVYQDRSPEPLQSFGRWQLDGTRLILQQPEQELIFFATRSGGWLKADTEGRPIQSQLNYSLQPVPWQPLKLEGPIQGMLLYFADSAILSECRTGALYPIEMNNTWLELERSYLSSRSGAGSYLYLEAQGQQIWTQPEEGPARHHLHLQQVQNTTANATCPVSPAAIEGQSWQLSAWSPLALDLPDLTQFQAEQLPQLTLTGQQMSGFTGCNSMAGPALFEGNRLNLGPVASTRRYCHDTAELESQFLPLLEQVTYTGLEGNAWVWYDADMRRLASFQAQTPETP
ncbi:META domain-containing protein [Nitrincola tapanii]|uniref:META domain-containing protein n=1 Tax=Nitrincola tapanii TaxID=1708751 RepID=A0A5A9WAH6_9GAMM|nr:META domain-containing protein [Nitrincola tapanii]KAA0876431.1 META domain-containing protein [Nitrincola tapanii]